MSMYIFKDFNYKRIIDEFKYTGRMSETRSIKTHGQNYLGGCVEFNLNNDGHSFIFRLFDTTAEVQVYNYII